MNLNLDMCSMDNAVNTFRCNSDQLCEFEVELSRQMNSTIDVASELMSRIEGQPEKISNALDSFKELMSGDVDMENDICRMKTAIRGICDRFTEAAGETVTDDLEQLLKELYEVTPNQTKSADHARYKELVNLVTEASQQSPDSEGDLVVPQTQPVNNSIDFIVIQDGNSIPLDPLTKKPIEDPVRNSICKHVYERSTILAHISRRTGGSKCPMIGCSSIHLLTQEILEEHEELRQKIRRKRTAQNTMI